MAVGLGASPLGNAECRNDFDAEMQRCRDAEMQRCRDAEMQRCRDAEMQRCRDAEASQAGRAGSHEFGRWPKGRACMHQSWDVVPGYVEQGRWPWGMSQYIAPEGPSSGIVVS
ncbi:hypothetical protein RISK_004984 [Rhodopirellula islandica]|uniref:Uncharacterized protein n=1 Tax=Rhodopirellula islandica TaxID=595434 RepID=A0A0J1EBU8_RHOIS|nr:hypothetical protein RISK_004984 [Rhodopirellula islandica]